MSPVERKWLPGVVLAVGVPVAIALSYLLALAGEPQSVWFWRDILGILR